MVFIDIEIIRVERLQFHFFPASVLIHNLDALADRAVPVLGWSIMAADVAIISFNTVNRFNTSVRSEDKIW